MKYCDQCGKLLSENAKFCPACGAPVTAEESLRSSVNNPVAKQAEVLPVCAGSGIQTGEQETNRNSSLVQEEPGGMVETGSKIAENKLLTYLEKVFLLEKSVYTQDDIIQSLTEKMDSLGHEGNLREPGRPAECTGNITLDNMWTAFVCGAIVGGIVGLFVGHLLGGAILGGLLLLVTYVVGDWATADAENRRRQQAYNGERERYAAALAADKLRVEKELMQKQKLGEIRFKEKEQREETAEILNQYYEENIVFPKYRNLVAICSFYEYFMSGRCSTLTGYEGAYNIFENEVRLDRICTKLEEVVQKLEEIKVNQYVLYDAIQEGNRISRHLLEESMKQTQLAESTMENTALAAHYAEVSANNTEACAWIGLANHISIEEGKR